MKVRLLLPPQHSSNSNLDAGGIAMTCESADEFVAFAIIQGYKIIHSLSLKPYGYIHVSQHPYSTNLKCTPDIML
jgi:hypothetical protein